MNLDLTIKNTPLKISSKKSSPLKTPLLKTSPTRGYNKRSQERHRRTISTWEHFLLEVLRNPRSFWPTHVRPQNPNYGGHDFHERSLRMKTLLHSMNQKFPDNEMTESTLLSYFKDALTIGRKCAIVPSKILLQPERLNLTEKEYQIVRNEVLENWNSEFGYHKMDYLLINGVDQIPTFSWKALRIKNSVLINISPNILITEARKITKFLLDFAVENDRNPVVNPETQAPIISDMNLPQWLEYVEKEKAIPQTSAEYQQEDFKVDNILAGRKLKLDITNNQDRLEQRDSLSLEELADQFIGNIHHYPEFQSKPQFIGSPIYDMVN